MRILATFVLCLTSVLILLVLTNSLAHLQTDWVLTRLNVLSRGSRTVADLHLSHLEWLFGATRPGEAELSWADPEFGERAATQQTIGLIGPIRAPFPLGLVAVATIVVTVVAALGTALWARRLGTSATSLLLKVPHAGATGPHVGLVHSLVLIAAHVVAIPALCAALTYDLRSQSDPTDYLGAPLLPLLMLVLLVFLFHGASAVVRTAELAHSSALNAGTCPVCDYPVIKGMCPECGWGVVPIMGAKRLFLSLGVFLVVISAIGAAAIVTVARTIDANRGSMTLAAFADRGSTSSPLLVPSPNWAFQIDSETVDVLLIPAPSDRPPTAWLFTREPTSTEWVRVVDVRALKIGETRLLQASSGASVVRANIYHAGMPGLRFSFDARALIRMPVADAKSLVDPSAPPTNEPANAKASKGVTQTQALITGALSHADRFEDGVVKFLSDQGSNATAWRVDASFGVFGSLPLVGVTFDDAFVLLDATDGTLDGPFGLESPLDATVLLASHSGYTSGTTVRYHNVNGCGAVARPRWRPTAPPGGPFTPRPAAPNLPPPPIVIPGVPPGYPTLPLDPSIPGWWTDWACSTTPGPGPWAATCTCYSYGRYDDPGGGSHWVRRKCVGNFPCNAGPVGTPPGQFPAVPEPDGTLNEPPFPTPDPSISPGASWNCPLEYYF